MNPSINTKLAQEKLNRIVQEIQSDKVFLTCGRHGYVAHHKLGNAAVTPPVPNNCPDCWKAYYFTIHALTAPHMRQEHLDELEEVIAKTVEMADKGKFDFVPDANPEITIHKDAADDETGADKIIIPGVN